MKIFGKNIDTHIPVVERHGLSKVIRHTTERVVGRMPFVSQNLQHRTVETATRDLISSFITSQARALTAEGATTASALKRIGRDTTLTDDQKLAQILAIVQANVPDVDGALKAHAQTSAIGGTVRRAARYDARQDPARIERLMALKIRILEQPLQLPNSALAPRSPFAPPNNNDSRSAHSSYSKSKKISFSRGQSPGDDLRSRQILASGARENDKTIVIRREYSISCDDSAFIQDGPSRKKRQVVLMQVRLPSDMTAIGHARAESSSGIPVTSEGAIDDLPEFKDDHLDLTNAINSGTMGTIYKVELASGQESSHCAVKRYQPKYQESGWEEFDNNSYVQSRLGPSGNPHIAKFLGPLIIETEHEDQELDYVDAVSPDQSAVEGIVQQKVVQKTEEILLVFEFIDGTHLGRMFDDLRGKLSASNMLRLAQHVIYGAVDGLAALEKNGITHNDIKPNNILFDTNTREAKLIDLGNAALHGHYRELGNPAYTAPERLNTMKSKSSTGGSISPHGPGSSIISEPTPIFKTEESDLKKIEEAESRLSTSHLHVSQKDRKEFQVKETLDRDRKKKSVPVSNKTDAYSIGQVLHTLVEGQEFFVFGKSPDNPAALLFKLATSDAALRKRGQVFPQEYQTDDTKKAAHYYDFVNKAMNHNDVTRYTCTQLLNHPFLQNRPSPDEVRAILDKVDHAGGE